MSEINREAALSSLKGPGIGVIVTGIIGVLASIGFAAYFMMLPQMIETAKQQMENDKNITEEQKAQFEQNVEQLEGMLESMKKVGMVGMVLGLLLSAVVIFGAVKMMNASSRGLAYVACILSLIICCPGLPFGIWGLVTLGKPDVKAVFGEDA